VDIYQRTCVRCGRTVWATATDWHPQCAPACADLLTHLSGTVYVSDGTKYTLPAEQPREGEVPK
jgi:endogenous inhibitor of DNA gyrase (YacG/DUF329 family)